MGILDEAIREHLDLRRRHGADDTELKELEDEAFGPPSRPGEPDFPEKGDDGEAAQPADVTPTESAAAPEAPTELVSPEEAAAEEKPAADASTDAVAVEDKPDEPEPEPTATEQPVVPPVEEKPSSEPPPEPEAAEEAESTFFDQEMAELELDDLDLEIDEEPAAESPADPEAPIAPEAPPAPETPPAPAEPGEEEGEPPPPDEPEPAVEPEADTAEPAVESLETVEHDVEQHMPPPPPPTEDPASEEESPEAEGGAEEDEDSDVLEETPEFLQDRPEDDELWFEQGKPKDFDF
jgi:hypothetical protein